MLNNFDLMDMADRETELSLFYHGQTVKAICVSDDGASKVWIPKSQCSYIGESELHGETPEITIIVKEWIAQDKDLI